MVDLRNEHEEAGTTLAELLVVILLLTVVGSVTTVGIVQAFDTQLVATRGAESLDELRLSVQRMRDDIRSADEVCASSTSTRLAIWTDRDDAGVLGEDEDVEVVIFDVDPTTSQLTRSVRNSGTTTLISDVIVTPGGDVFLYDVPPTEQEADLTCDTALVTTPSTVATTRVTLDIQVQNVDGVNTVDTVTTMRLRNAGLADITSGGGAGTSNDRPTASVNLPAQCHQNAPCELDGEGTDPESGVLTFEWDLDNDGAFDDATVEDPTVTFPDTGMVNVALRVTDDQGLVSSPATGTIEVVPPGTNLRPVAAFTYECTGATCSFDADESLFATSSESGATETTDAESEQSDLTYEWTFVPEGQAPITRTGTSVGADHTLTFSASPTSVTLLVTDPGGEFDESSASIITSADTIRVKALSAEGGPKETNSFTATLTVAVETTSGFARDGVQVTVDIANADASVGTCTTGDAGSSGKCDIVVTAHHNNTVTFTVNTLSDGAGATYDAGQNLATCIKVAVSSISNEPADGNCP